MYEDSFNVVLRSMTNDLENLIEVRADALEYLSSLNFEDGVQFVQKMVQGHIIDVSSKLMKALQTQGYRIKKYLNGSGSKKREIIRSKWYSYQLNSKPRISTETQKVCT